MSDVDFKICKCFITLLHILPNVALPNSRIDRVYFRSLHLRKVICQKLSPDRACGHWVM